MVQSLSMVTVGRAMQKQELKQHQTAVLYVPAHACLELRFTYACYVTGSFSCLQHNQVTGVGKSARYYNAKIGPRREKTCLRGFANNTVADQPAHPRSLISAFVIRFLERIICKLTTGEISMFWLVSIAEENGLSLALSETPKTGFVASMPK